MELKNISNNLVEISTDSEHILHKIGNKDYPIIRRIIVHENRVSDLEEVDATSAPFYMEDERDAKIEELIRQRYSAGKEFAIQRKAINVLMSPATLSDEDAESSLSEYSDYNAYVEECIANAPQAILDDIAKREAESSADLNQNEL